MKTPRELILERHRAIESRLERIRPEELAAQAREAMASTAHLDPVSQEAGFWAVAREFWMESIRPWRRAWIGMAAAWIVILVSFAATHDMPQTARVKVSPPSPELMAALREQRQMMLQLFETSVPARPVESKIPGPRSEQRIAIYFI
jgi:hypothetical protein